MSTTAQHTLEEVQGRDDPANIFTRYVFEDPSICSCCFRRIRVGGSTTVWGSEGHDKEDKGTRAVAKRMYETDRGEAGPEGIIVGTRQAPNPERVIYPECTVCEDCGSVGGRALDDTLPKAEAVSRAGTLADRLHELGEPADVDVLKRAVAKLKSHPDLVGYDTEIFERATKIAVRRARQ